MKKIYYPNCSELLADFEVQDPKIMLDILKKLIKKYDWHAEPQPTVEFLTRMKKDRQEQIYLTADNYDATCLHYGDNGYDDALTYWLAEPGNNDWDSKQYSFMAAAKDDAGAIIKTYDGGKEDGFQEWYQTHWSELERLIMEARKRQKYGKKI